MRPKVAESNPAGRSAGRRDSILLQSDLRVENRIKHIDEYRDRFN